MKNFFQNNDWMNIRNGYILIHFCILGITLCSIPAHATGVQMLARDHVNLIKVVGEKISDVVFDTEALEVEPDKSRGIVFIRVRPAWLALVESQGYIKAEKGQPITAAFFNTSSGNYGVTFQVAPIVSQTIEITPPPKSSTVTKQNNELQRKALIPDMKLEKFSDSDYMTELKVLVKKAICTENFGNFNLKIGQAFSVEEGESSKIQSLMFEPTNATVNSFAITESKAWFTENRLVEIFTITNLSTKTRKLPLGQLLGYASGALAIAASHTELTAGQCADVVVIRNREACVVETDLSTKAQTIELIIQGIERAEDREIK